MEENKLVYVALIGSLGMGILLGFQLGELSTLPNCYLPDVSKVVHEVLYDYNTEYNQTLPIPKLASMNSDIASGYYMGLEPPVIAFNVKSITGDKNSFTGTVFHEICHYYLDKVCGQPYYSDGTEGYILEQTFCDNYALIKMGTKGYIQQYEEDFKNCTIFGNKISNQTKNKEGDSSHG